MPQQPDWITDKIADAMLLFIRRLFYTTVVSWVTPCRRCGVIRWSHPQYRRFRQHGWLPPSDSYFDLKKHDVPDK